ncbi:MAG: 50S ribosomal protein L30 [Acidobacteria bacterium]|nr:50S ribosomal protein L30 [Acidobacteriota bacterium]
MTKVVSPLLGKQVIVTLKRSTIATTPKHRAFMQTMGLKKVGDFREMVYTANVHGMVKLIPHLVDVQAKG